MRNLTATGLTAATATILASCTTPISELGKQAEPYTVSEKDTSEREIVTNSPSGDLEFAPVVDFEVLMHGHI